MKALRNRGVQEESWLETFGHKPPEQIVNDCGWDKVELELFDYIQMPKPFVHNV